MKKYRNCLLIFFILSVFIGWAAPHENLKKQLIIAEGYRHFAYKCTSGHYTIGVGRNIDKTGGKGLSDSEINLLLNNDIKYFSNGLSKYMWFQKLDRNRKNVIIEMAFNLGIHGLLGFKKMIHYLSVQDYTKASHEALNSLWAKQVGNRSIRISNIIRYG